MPEPCVATIGPCGVDSIATCQSCGRRACNKHLILDATFLFHSSRRTGLFRPVKLSHPNGDSYEELGMIVALVYMMAGWDDAALDCVPGPGSPDNPGFRAFASGVTRCYRCRIIDGASAVDAPSSQRNAEP
jgi:hypothetical protein